MARVRAPVSERVVQNVARTTDTDPLELPPIYETVDPDSLDSLVSGLSDGEVSFTYAGFEVTVGSDGAIDLEERPVRRAAPRPEGDD